MNHILSRPSSALNALAVLSAIPLLAHFRSLRLRALTIFLPLLLAAAVAAPAGAQGTASTDFYIYLSPFSQNQPTITYNEAITAKVNILVGADGQNLQGVTITVTVDGGSSQSAVTDENGNAYFNLGQLSIGDHTVTGSFAGNATYAGNSGSTTATVVDAPFTFVGTQGTTLFGSGGVGDVEGVAVDAQDNLYVADKAQNTVKKEDAFGNISTLPLTGLSGPIGLALDSSGTLYVADSGNNRVLMLTSSGTQTVLPISGLSGPTYLAYDRRYDLLYVADPTNGRIVQFTPASATATDYVTGLTALRGIAVDDSGELLYSDRNAGFVLTDGPSYVQPIFGPISEPGGIAYGVGSTYLSDASTNTIVRYDSNGSQIQINNAGNPVISMAVDSAGRVYLALGSRVDVLAPTLGRVPDLPTGAQAYTSLIFQVPQSKPAFSVTASPSTLFSNVGSPSCPGTVGSCNVTVNFAPQVAGFNLGAFTATLGGTAYTALLWGSGIGAGAAFTPGIPSSTVSAAAQIGGVALDLAGNYYVSDTQNNNVQKVTPSGTRSTLGFTGLSNPTQLAVDATGAVYVLDVGNDRIERLDASGQQTDAFVGEEDETIYNLSAFTLDGSGRLIVAGLHIDDERRPVHASGRMAGADRRGALAPQRRSAGKRTSTRPADQAPSFYSIIYADQPNPTGFTLPFEGVDYLNGFTNGDIADDLPPVSGVAVDPYGNVYAVSSAGDLMRIGVDGSFQQLATGLTSPLAVTVDASETAYVLQSTAGAVTTVSSSGAQGSVPFSAVKLPVSLAMDAYGDLLVGDSYDQNLLYLDRTQQAYNFGNVAVGSSATLNGSVTNIGNQPFTFPSQSPIPGDTNFVQIGSSGACSNGSGSVAASTTAPAASCDLSYTFTPPSAGPFTLSGVLTVSPQAFTGSTGGGAMSFSGTGAGAGSLTIAPGTQTFPATAVGSTSATLTSTITNGTSQPVYLSSGTLTDATDFTQSNTCGGILSPNATCTVSFTFTPQTAGALTSTYSINNLDTPNSPLLVTLSGSGTAAAAAQATLTPAMASFGSETTGTTSAAQTFTLANAGNAALSISSIALSGTGAGSFTIGANTCGSSLAAGGSCTIAVTFLPTSAGSAAAMLSVVDAVGTQSSSLSGTGTAPAAAQAALTPATADFGSINNGSTSAAQTFTLTNAGNAALTITGVSLTGSNATAFAIGANGCGGSLANGGSCSITISFTPSAAGSLSAALTVTDSVGTQSSTLTGTGVAVVPADFTITAAPPAQSGSPGAAVSYTVQLASVNADDPFTSAVALSAAGLPSGGTVSFSPASVVPGAGQAASSTMTVTVPALSATDVSPSGRSTTVLAAGFSLGSILLLCMARWKRRWPALRLLGLALFAVTAAAATLTGCSTNATGFALPSSTYTLTVTGTSGSTVHTTTVTLTVK